MNDFMGMSMMDEKMCNEFQSQYNTGTIFYCRRKSNNMQRRPKPVFIEKHKFKKKSSRRKRRRGYPSSVSNHSFDYRVDTKTENTYACL